MNKAKKFLIGLLAFASVSAFAFGFAGCEDEHEHSYTKTVIAPTCIEKGYTRYTCDCGETYEDDYIDALGHCFDQEIAEYKYLKYSADCTSPAVYFKSCTCGAMGKETFFLGEEKHTFNQEIADDIYLHSAASCTQEAIYYKSCACGQKGTNTFTYGERLSHDIVDCVCTVCAVDFTSRGLEYELSKDETYYIVAGLGECTDTDLYIPSMYNDLPVTIIGSNAFSHCSNLNSITLPDSLIRIGGYAFYDCGDGLTSIYYTGDIASWCAIDFVGRFANPVSYAEDFYIDNEKVVDLVIPNGVQKINDYAFCGASFDDLTIGNSVTTIGNSAFYNCDSLTNVTIGDSVTTIGDSAFAYCDSLTNIAIGNSVTTIGERAFYSCDFLQNVSMGGSVKIIESSSFSGCERLTNITIPSSIETIKGAAFSGCRSLKSVYYYDNIIAWTEIDFEFLYANPLSNRASLYINNEKIVNLVLPDGIETINDYAFDRAKVESVTMADSVTTIGKYAFRGCPMTSVVIGASVTTIGDTAFAGVNIESVTIPNSVTTIGDEAFEYCYSLTSVTIGNSVTTIGDRAFEFCTNLTSVTIGSSVTTIGCDMLNNCRRLENVYYLGDIASWCAINFKGGLLYRGDLYIDNEKVVHLVVPYGVEKINSYSFFNCHSLESVTISASVKKIEYGAFADCCSLGNAIFPIGSIWHITDYDKSTGGEINVKDSNQAAVILVNLTDYKDSIYRE